MGEKKSKSRFKFKPNVACHPVKKIIGFYIGKEKRRYYRVQWTPSWVPEECLVGCENLIKQFFVEENIINKDSNQSNKSEIKETPLKIEDEHDEERDTEDSPKSMIIDDDIAILTEADDNFEETDYLKFGLKDASTQSYAEKTDKEVEVSRNSTEDSDSNSCGECQRSSDKVSHNQGSCNIIGSPSITKIESFLKELNINKIIELEIRKQIEQLKVNYPEDCSTHTKQNIDPLSIPYTEPVNINPCVLEETQDDKSVDIPLHTNSLTDQNNDQLSPDISQNIPKHVLRLEDVPKVESSNKTDPEPLNLPNPELEGFITLPCHLSDHTSKQSLKDIPQDIFVLSHEQTNTPEVIPEHKMNQISQNELSTIPGHLLDQVLNQLLKDIPLDIPTYEQTNTPEIIPEPEPSLHPQNELINLTVRKEFVDDRKNKTYETRQRMRTLFEDDSSSDSDEPLSNLIQQSIVIKRPAFVSLTSTPSKSGDHTISSDNVTNNYDVDDYIFHNNFSNDILKLITVDDIIPIVTEDHLAVLDFNSNDPNLDSCALHDKCDNADPTGFSVANNDTIDDNYRNDAYNSNDIDFKINESNENVASRNGCKMGSTNIKSSSSPFYRNMAAAKSNFVDNNNQNSKIDKKISLDNDYEMNRKGINIESKSSHESSKTSLETNSLSNTLLFVSPSPKKDRVRPFEIISPNNIADKKFIGSEMSNDVNAFSIDKENQNEQSHVCERSFLTMAKSIWLDFSGNSNKTTEINDSFCPNNCIRKEIGSDDDTLSADSDIGDSNQVFECDVCEESFQESVLLHRHLLIHCKNQPSLFIKKEPLKYKDNIAKAIKTKKVYSQMKENRDDYGNDKTKEDNHNSKEKRDSLYKLGSDEDSLPLAWLAKSDEENVPLADLVRSYEDVIPLAGLAKKEGREIKDKRSEEAKKVKLTDHISEALCT